MVLVKNLKEYYDGLPKSMKLKKKVIKCIMKAKEPLSQKEIKDLADDADWTNVRRILKELLDEGLIVKERKGIVDYYVKVEFHGGHTRFIDGDITYFIDEFLPDFQDEDKYVRIKQVIQKDKENYETLGKITIRTNKIDNLIEQLKKLQSEVKNVK